jgi:hypothetical protein
MADETTTVYLAPTTSGSAHLRIDCHHLRGRVVTQLEAKPCPAAGEEYVEVVGSQPYLWTAFRLCARCVMLARTDAAVTRAPEAV